MHLVPPDQVSPHDRKTRGGVSGPPAADTALTYRVSDAVAVSGLSRSSIYNAIKDGRLRSVLVCGRRLIPAEALRQLLQGAA